MKTPADSYHQVKRDVTGYWGVWLNLSASGSEAEQTRRRPDRLFMTIQEAEAWADKEGFAEHGVCVNDALLCPNRVDMVDGTVECGHRNYVGAGCAACCCDAAMAAERADNRGARS